MRVKCKPISEKNTKNEKWDLLCEPNKALREKENKDQKWSSNAHFEHKPYSREESERRS